MGSNVLRSLLALVFALSSSCATTPSSHTVNPPPLPSPREPAEISKVSEDDYRVEWCANRQDAGKKWNITTPKEKVGGRLDANGCLLYTFRDGRIRPGDHLVYSVEDSNRASETVPGRQGGGGTPGQPSRPTEPTRQTYDLDKARNSADNHARCTANAVAGLYGKYENHRYNFYRGFRQGVNLYNWSNWGDLRSTPEYRLGAQEGEVTGSAQGRRAGENEAVQEASARAANDVRQRYAEVVDQQRPPDTEMKIPAAVFEGIPADIREPRSLEDRVLAMEGEFRSYITRQAWEFEGDTFAFDSWRNEWGLINFYRWNDYSFELVRSWYRDDWAFDLFRARRFRRCADQADYYDRISNPSLYSNASQAASTYRSTFKRVYDRVIDEKWDRIVRADNPTAQYDGQNYGYRVAREYTRDLGYTTAYRLAFTESSIDGYQSRFAEAYSGRFDQDVRLYESSVIPQVRAQVVDLNGERKALVVGYPLGVDLLTSSNLGRQPGEVSVEIAGPAVESPIRRTVRFEPSSTIKDNRVVANLGILGKSVKPDGQVDVRIRVGNQEVTDQFQMNWRTLASVFPTSTGPTLALQADFMYAAISSEIDARYGGGLFNARNDWQNDDPSLLLVQAVLIAEKLPAEQKANYRALAERLKKFVGKEPSRFFSSRKHEEWTALNKLFKRMQ